MATDHRGSGVRWDGSTGNVHGTNAEELGRIAARVRVVQLPRAHVTEEQVTIDPGRVGVAQREKVTAVVNSGGVHRCRDDVVNLQVCATTAGGARWMRGQVLGTHHAPTTGEAPRLTGWA